MTMTFNRPPDHLTVKKPAPEIPPVPRRDVSPKKPPTKQVLPSPVSPASKPTLLETHQPVVTAPPQAKPRRSAKKPLLLGVGIVATLLVAGGNLLMIHRSKEQASNNGLPAAIVNQPKDFIPYYLNKDHMAGWKVDPSSASYKNDVLAFTLTGSDGKIIAFTEISMPQDLDTKALDPSQEFDTPYGHGYITDGGTHTAAALLTKDKTWILANTPNPIGSNTIREILLNFTPGKH